MVVGIAAAAALVGLSAPVTTVLGGAALGSTAGVLAHVATAPEEYRGPPSKMLHELRRDD
jgi:hypothetical protein